MSEAEIMGMGEVLGRGGSGEEQAEDRPGGTHSCGHGGCGGRRRAGAAGASQGEDPQGGVVLVPPPDPSPSPRLGLPRPS